MEYNKVYHIVITAKSPILSVPNDILEKNIYEYKYNFNHCLYNE